MNCTVYIVVFDYELLTGNDLKVSFAMGERLGSDKWSFESCIRSTAVRLTNRLLSKAGNVTHM